MLLPSALPEPPPLKSQQGAPCSTRPGATAAARPWRWEAARDWAAERALIGWGMPGLLAWSACAQPETGVDSLAVPSPALTSAPRWCPRLPHPFQRPARNPSYRPEGAPRARGELKDARASTPKYEGPGRRESDVIGRQVAGPGPRVGGATEHALERGWGAGGVEGRALRRTRACVSPSQPPTRGTLRRGEAASADPPAELWGADGLGRLSVPNIANWKRISLLRFAFPFHFGSFSIWPFSNFKHPPLSAWAFYC